jgi:hypothetical protein
MYSHISENNFGPSNQIIVPTGYNTFLIKQLSDEDTVVLEVIIDNVKLS